MRSLVTGGAGFIGSNLVDALLERGDEVLVVDDLSTGREANLRDALGSGAELVAADIASPEAASALEGFRPETVFHLAAQADVRKAVEDPRLDAAVNVIGTIAVLEGARRAGSRVIFAATGGAVYGEGEGRSLPFAESAAAAPETPYGVSKLAGELYVEMYRRLHGVEGIAMRFANVYGPRQDPHGEAGVVAIFCGRLLDGERPTVFGDGLQTRDYVFVGDTVEALIAADRALAAGTPLSGPLNVGTGRETSVLELVAELGSIAEQAFEAELAPARQGEVQRVAIDPGAAGEQLGWAPRTSLRDGLAQTLESVRAERA